MVIQSKDGLPSSIDTWITSLSLRASQVAIVVKNQPANAGDIRDERFDPGPGRSPEGGYGNPLQYCCLGKPMDRGAWRAVIHRVAKSQTQLKCLSTHACTSYSKFHTNCWRVCSFSLTGQTGRQNHENSLPRSTTNSCYLTIKAPWWCCVSLSRVRLLAVRTGSSVHGIFQTRKWEWVAISFSRGSSGPRDWTWASRITGRLLTVWATRESLDTDDVVSQLLFLTLLPCKGYFLYCSKF